jgi:chromosome segregation ATPase
LLSLALKGKQGGSFDIVVKKIEKLMANLETEQKDDEKKKAWCNDELDKTDEDIKWTTRSVSDSETITTNTKEQLTSVTAEIDAVAQEIKDLDAATKAATEQREAENAAYKEGLSESTAAKEVLQMATTRLNQFYNPKLALVQNRALGQAAPSVYGHDADDEAPSFVQLKARLSIDEGSSASRQANDDRYDDRREDAEAHSEPTSSSTEKSSGALAMLDALMDDIDKQVAVLKTTEQEAQQDYEVFLEDSKEKRAGDTKAMSDKESAKAEVEVELLDAKEKMKSEEASLVDSKKEVKELHADCDDLLAEFEEKKTARKDEIEALSRAKAVLSGASYE